MMKPIIFILLASLCISFAQDTIQFSDDDSLVYVVTGKELYRFNSTSEVQLCASNFTDARGVAVDKDGTIFVADEGDVSIYTISKDCAEKKLFLENDGELHSWLYPRDLTVDEEGNLYVSMMQNDDRWPLYELPRRRYAKQRHVYKLKYDDNKEFSENEVEILAGGINNGRDIFHVRWVKGEGLYGTRHNRYVVKYVDNRWEDWLGPNNMFRINDEKSAPLLGAKQVDVAFERCGYLAIASDANKQFFTCPDKENVSNCSTICKFNETHNEEQLQAVAYEECVSDDCIDFDLETLRLDEETNRLSDRKCKDMDLPYGVIIDCECNLLISDSTKGEILKFTPNQNGDKFEFNDSLSPEVRHAFEGKRVFGMASKLSDTCGQQQE